MNIGNLLIAILIVATSLIIWGVYGWPPFKQNVGDFYDGGNDDDFECGTMPRDPQEL